MDPLDTGEQYAIIKLFEEGEIFEQSAEVLEEEERLCASGILQSASLG